MYSRWSRGGVGYGAEVLMNASLLILGVHRRFSNVLGGGWRQSRTGRDRRMGHFAVCKGMMLHFEGRVVTRYGALGGTLGVRGMLVKGLRLWRIWRESRGRVALSPILTAV